MRQGLLVFIGIFAAALAGCSQGDTQTRYRVSGEVKLGGQPVPYGEVLFTPDGAAGNSGAQGIATIKDGKYDTRGSRAPGVGGGAMVARITALSGEGGKLLSEQDVKVDLPKGDSTYNFDLPAAAAKPKAGRPEI
jgi:hypothetical protein